MPTPQEQCETVREKILRVHDCAVRKTLDTQGDLQGYEVKIWFPVCNRSVYGRYGNLTRYGDETHVREQWDSPRVPNNVDRKDVNPKPLKQTHDPEAPTHYAPDYEGKALVLHLEKVIRFSGGLEAKSDPYGIDPDTRMVLPNDLTHLPTNSKVQVKGRNGKILQFHSQDEIRKGTLWMPVIRVVVLIPSEDE